MGGCPPRGLGSIPARRAGRGFVQGLGGMRWMIIEGMRKRGPGLDIVKNSLPLWGISVVFAEELGEQIGWGCLDRKAGFIHVRDPLYFPCGLTCVLAETLSLSCWNRPLIVNGDGFHFAHFSTIFLLSSISYIREFSCVSEV